MPTWAWFVLVPVAFFILLFVLQAVLVLRMKAKRGKAAPTDLPGKAGKAVRGGKRALFYFYSPACGACRAMTPVATKLAKKSGRVFAVNISSDMPVARAFGVMGTPATVLVEEGTIKEYLVGPMPAPRLEELAVGC